MASDDRAVKTYCRICQGSCGLEVTVVDGRIAKVRGDREDPLSRGYICFKGIQAQEQHCGPTRLLHSLGRDDKGVLREMSSAEALSAAGRALAAILEQYGPDSIAFFMGTQSVFNTLAPPMIRALAKAIGTHRLYGTMTIDQSAKWIAEARLGTWDAGPQDFAHSDVWMFVGSNPLVSLVAGAGPHQFVFSDPVKMLKAAKQRGIKVIVVDPRRSETAQYADLFLQPRPGRDGLIIAAMLHVILTEGWHDPGFCAEHVEDLGEFRAALAPFSVDLCAQLAGVAAGEIRAAARLFAKASRTGMAGSGTGPNMARHSNITEHLIEALNVVCGRFPRAGERLTNPGVLQPMRPRRAQVRPPARTWETGPRSSRHGLGMMKGQMMSATLADDILFSGPERIRALICVGGNPAVALPDQRKAIEALSALDLLLVIEPRLGATARLAHYVIAPTLQFERADHTGMLEFLLNQPFAHFTSPVVHPPLGADVVDEWYALWSLARSLGLTLRLAGRQLPMDQPPEAMDLLALVTTGSRVPFEAAAVHVGGQIYPDEGCRVLPADATGGRFRLLADDVAEELIALGAELYRKDDQNEDVLMLIVRRHREVMNSSGTDFAATRQRLAGSPAYFNPDDLARLGLTSGDTIRIESATGSIQALAKADPDLRPGVIAMSHGWPGLPTAPFEATNALVDSEESVQQINHMPVMTGIAVRIRPVVHPGAS
jgi:anaerobic selenocysteine-containing dehydrogenase